MPLKCFFLCVPGTINGFVVSSKDGKDSAAEIGKKEAKYGHGRERGRLLQCGLHLLIPGVSFLKAFLRSPH